MNFLRSLPHCRVVLILLLGLLAASLVVSCGDDPTPTPTATVAPAPVPTATPVPEPTPTATPVPTPTARTVAPAPTVPVTSAPTPAATVAPDPTAPVTPAPEPTATPVLEVGETGLDRYLSLCTLLDATDAGDFGTYGEFSARLEEVIEEAYAFPPPVEVFDWHLAVLAFLNSMNELVGSQPADDPIDPFILAPVLPSVANLQEAELLWDPDLRERMAEIGCVASPP